jgi:hypothetical protein
MSEDHQFKPGNQFWKMRSKHGRDRIFKDPQTMLKACYEYFEYQSQQKWEKTDVIRGGENAGQQISHTVTTPFTIEGLCIFLDVNTVYFNHFENALNPDKSEIDNDFSKVITHVKEVIRKQKMEGASVGAFNANIIARDLGLTDKQEHDHKGGLTIKTSVKAKKKIDEIGDD